MSRFFPHPAYAEEQPLYGTILTTHVLHRGFQTGAFIGVVSSAARSLIKRNPSASTTPAPATLHAQQSIRLALMRSVGQSALITTAVMVPGMIYWMWGREEIEWRDRSWRLLENEGQKEVDDWSLIGTVGGAVATARGALTEAGPRAQIVRLAGGAGIGSLAGVVGYMAWRYGVHRGKRGGDGEK
jgi:Protein of unknown function (DUF1757)